MTSLYRLDATAPAVARAFAADAGRDPWAGGHVAPGTFAPVITAGREFIAGARPAGKAPRRMVPRLWGVPPPPSAPDQRRAVLTVRNVDSPFWIGNLRNSEFRCLVPATAFMAWGAGIDTEGRRMRHWFAPPDDQPMAMAAVCKDSEVPGFAILTRPATPPLRALGIDRMPVVLVADRMGEDLWLHAGWDKAATVLSAPVPALGQWDD